MTAREPSAVEVIVQVDHEHRITCTGPGEVGCRAYPGWHSWAAHRRHVAEAQIAALKAAGFVVATRDEIRAMTPREQAELIDGTVMEYLDAEEDLLCGYVVGPWREVQS